MGATFLSSSIDKESLKNEEGNFDIVVNTLFSDDSELYKAHQRLTAPGGVYIGVGLPHEKCMFHMDYEYLSKYQVKIAGSNVGTLVC